MLASRPVNFPAASFLPILGLLLTAQPSFAQDTDADGMPDAWEETWDLSSDNPSDSDVDFDRDGLTAFQEYGLSLQGKGAGPLGEWILQKLGKLPKKLDCVASRDYGCNPGGISH